MNDLTKIIDKLKKENENKEQDVEYKSQFIDLTNNLKVLNEEATAKEKIVNGNVQITKDLNIEQYKKSFVKPNDDDLVVDIKMLGLDYATNSDLINYLNQPKKIRNVLDITNLSLRQIWFVPNVVNSFPSPYETMPIPFKSISSSDMSSSFDEYTGTSLPYSSQFINNVFMKTANTLKVYNHNGLFVCGSNEFDSRTSLKFYDKGFVTTNKSKSFLDTEFKTSPGSLPSMGIEYANEYNQWSTFMFMPKDLKQLKGEEGFYSELSNQFKEGYNKLSRKMKNNQMDIQSKYLFDTKNIRSNYSSLEFDNDMAYKALYNANPLMYKFRKLRFNKDVFNIFNTTKDFASHKDSHFYVINKIKQLSHIDGNAKYESKDEYLNLTGYDDSNVREDSTDKSYWEVYEEHNIPYLEVKSNDTFGNEDAITRLKKIYSDVYYETSEGRVSYASMIDINSLRQSKDNTKWEFKKNEVKLDKYVCILDTNNPPPHNCVPNPEPIIKNTFSIDEVYKIIFGDIPHTNISQNDYQIYYNLKDEVLKLILEYDNQTFLSLVDNFKGDVESVQQYTNRVYEDMITTSTDYSIKVVNDNDIIAKTFNNNFVVISKLIEFQKDVYKVANLVLTYDSDKKIYAGNIFMIDIEYYLDMLSINNAYDYNNPKALDLDSTILMNGIEKLNSHLFDIMNLNDNLNPDFVKIIQNDFNVNEMHIINEINRVYELDNLYALKDVIPHDITLKQILSTTYWIDFISTIGIDELVGTYGFSREERFKSRIVGFKKPRTTLHSEWVTLGKRKTVYRTNKDWVKHRKNIKAVISDSGNDIYEETINEAAKRLNIDSEKLIKIDSFKYDYNVFVEFLKTTYESINSNVVITNSTKSNDYDFFYMRGINNADVGMFFNYMNMKIKDVFYTYVNLIAYTADDINILTFSVPVDEDIYNQTTKEKNAFLAKLKLHITDNANMSIDTILDTFSNSTLNPFNGKMVKNPEVLVIDKSVIDMEYTDATDTFTTTFTLKTFSKDRVKKWYKKVDAFTKIPETINEFVTRYNAMNLSSGISDRYETLREYLSTDSVDPKALETNFDFFDSILTEYALLLSNSGQDDYYESLIVKEKGVLSVDVYINTDKSNLVFNGLSHDKIMAFIKADTLPPFIRKYNYSLNNIDTNYNPIISYKNDGTGVILTRNITKKQILSIDERIITKDEKWYVYRTQDTIETTSTVNIEDYVISIKDSILHTLLTGKSMYEINLLDTDTSKIVVVKSKMIKNVNNKVRHIKVLYHDTTNKLYIYKSFAINVNYIDNSISYWENIVDVTNDNNVINIIDNHMFDVIDSILSSNDFDITTLDTFKVDLTKYATITADVLMNTPISGNITPALAPISKDIHNVFNKFIELDDVKYDTHNAIKNVYLDEVKMSNRLVYLTGDINVMDLYPAEDNLSSDVYNGLSLISEGNPFVLYTNKSDNGIIDLHRLDINAIKNNNILDNDFIDNLKTKYKNTLPPINDSVYKPLTLSENNGILNIQSRYHDAANNKIELLNSGATNNLFNKPNDINKYGMKVPYDLIEFKNEPDIIETFFETFTKDEDEYFKDALVDGTLYNIFMTWYIPNFFDHINLNNPKNINVNANHDKVYISKTDDFYINLLLVFTNDIYLPPHIFEHRYDRYEKNDMKWYKDNTVDNKFYLNFDPSTMSATTFDRIVYCNGRVYVEHSSIKFDNLSNPNNDLGTLVKPSYIYPKLKDDKTLDFSEIGFTTKSRDLLDLLQLMSKKEELNIFKDEELFVSNLESTINHINIRNKHIGFDNPLFRISEQCFSDDKILSQDNNVMYLPEYKSVESAIQNTYDMDIVAKFSYNQSNLRNLKYVINYSDNVKSDRFYNDVTSFLNYNTQVNNNGLGFISIYHNKFNVLTTNGIDSNYISKPISTNMKYTIEGFNLKDGIVHILSDGILEIKGKAIFGYNTQNVLNIDYERFTNGETYNPLGITNQLGYGVIRFASNNIEGLDFDNDYQNLVGNFSYNYNRQNKNRKSYVVLDLLNNKYKLQRSFYNNHSKEFNVLTPNIVENKTIMQLYTVKKKNASNYKKVQLIDDFFIKTGAINSPLFSSSDDTKVTFISEINKLKTDGGYSNTLFQSLEHLHNFPIIGEGKYKGSTFNVDKRSLLISERNIFEEMKDDDGGSTNIWIKTKDNEELYDRYKFVFVDYFVDVVFNKETINIIDEMSKETKKIVLENNLYETTDNGDKYLRPIMPFIVDKKNKVLTIDIQLAKDVFNITYNEVTRLETSLGINLNVEFRKLLDNFHDYINKTEILKTSDLMVLCANVCDILLYNDNINELYDLPVKMDDISVTTNITALFHNSFIINLLDKMVMLNSDLVLIFSNFRNAFRFEGKWKLNNVLYQEASVYYIPFTKIGNTKQLEFDGISDDEKNKEFIEFIYN